MKYYKILSETACYFVLIRILIFGISIIFMTWFDKIDYHYDTDWYWYMLWWGMPFVIALFFSMKNKKSFFQKIGFLFFPILIVGTMYMGYENKQYWGYYFKRPTIFSELKQVKNINSISLINTNSIDRPFNISTENFLFEGIREVSDPYYESYYNFELTIYNNAPSIISSWNSISNSKSKNKIQ